MPGNAESDGQCFRRRRLRPAGTTGFSLNEPESLSLYHQGGMVQFSAIVTGATSYQWLSNNLPVTGATNSTLAYGPGSANVVAGVNYSLAATSANGSVTSSV